MTTLDANSPNFDQFQFVADLLQRQDDVLEQISELQTRIDDQIKEANQREEEETAELVPDDEEE